MHLAMLGETLAVLPPEEGSLYLYFDSESVRSDDIQAVADESAENEDYERLSDNFQHIEFLHLHKRHCMVANEEDSDFVDHF